MLLFFIRATRTCVWPPAPLRSRCLLADKETEPPNIRKTADRSNMSGRACARLKASVVLLCMLRLINGLWCDQWSESPGQSQVAFSPDCCAPAHLGDCQRQTLVTQVIFVIRGIIRIHHHTHLGEYYRCKISAPLATFGCPPKYHIFVGPQGTTQQFAANLPVGSLGHPYVQNSSVPWGNSASVVHLRSAGCC